MKTPITIILILILLLAPAAVSARPEYCFDPARAYFPFPVYYQGRWICWYWENDFSLWRPHPGSSLAAKRVVLSDSQFNQRLSELYSPNILTLLPLAKQNQLAPSKVLPRLEEQITTEAEKPSLSALKDQARSKIAGLEKEEAVAIASIKELKASLSGWQKLNSIFRLKKLGAQSLKLNITQKQAKLIHYYKRLLSRKLSLLEKAERDFARNPSLSSKAKLLDSVDQLKKALASPQERPSLGERLKKAIKPPNPKSRLWLKWISFWFGANYRTSAKFRQKAKEGSVIAFPGGWLWVKEVKPQSDGKVGVQYFYIPNTNYIPKPVKQGSAQ